MPFQEAYELEFAAEADEGAAPAVAPLSAGHAAGPAGPAGRTRVLLGHVAKRMRAAPLVVLFVASVIGFMAFTKLVSAWVTVFIAPEVLVPEAFGAAGGAAGDPVWTSIMLMFLATVTGLTGAFLVFWRRVAGWACLTAFAAWELVRGYVIYQILSAQFHFPAGTFPSFWEGMEPDDWTMMAIRFLFLTLLFVPPVLRWVGFLGPRRPSPEDLPVAVAASAQPVPPRES